MDKDEKKVAAGHARAVALSDDRRKEIAQKAAQARWGSGAKTVEVLAEGPVSLGGQDVPAFVLSDETRVLARAAFVRAIGRQGKVKGGRKYDQELQIPVFLAANNLKPFITSEIERNSKPVVFSWGGTEMIGYKAEFLLDVCNVFLDAERLGALRANQKHIADQCRILQRSFAKLGVVGLVDEATGYQRLRSHDALSKLLEQYVEKEIQQWVKTFPDAFYEQLFRLRDLDPGANTNRPAYFGHLTNDIVYDRIAPKLRDELKNTVPKNNAGRPKYHLHRHLTPDLGHPKLREHIASVVTIMRLSATWDDFRAKLDSIHPKWTETMKFNFDDF
jgi:hypothetical protein